MANLETVLAEQAVRAAEEGIVNVAAEQAVEAGAKQRSVPAALIVAGVTFVVVGAGVGGYLFFKKRKDAKAAAEDTPIEVIESNETDDKVVRVKK